MAFIKKIKNDELYIYMNGKLLYKSWLNLGYSKTFDLMAYDKETLISIKEKDQELNSNIKIKINKPF